METKINKKLRQTTSGMAYAICPKCHRKISAFAVILDEKQEIKYLCPYCEAVIAKSEAEAKDLYYEPNTEAAADTPETKNEA